MRAACIILAALVGLSALAAPHDAAYYKRTGTKPPMKVDGMIGPGLLYHDNIGVGISGGPMFHTDRAGPVLLLFSAQALRLDGINGTATASPSVGALGAWPPPPTAIPYSTPDRTIGVFGVSVLFKVGAK